MSWTSKIETLENLNEQFLTDRTKHSGNIKSGILKTAARNFTNISMKTNDL
jgi:hypothetical protein